ncbi:MAG: protein kinase [Pyrinomonadaceae bacterium]|nr:protein kinase [Pyrinomonadaceae bacterium]MCX7640182.1 protein kinase [Pyrinomonadaceae bacterium]MDW8303230.1 serine/threonine-protein kinase [Acidobacteriota bacterium]
MLLGEILDGKYKIERELGRGGMGAVYLATHLGTDRFVAVKVISPQFMKRAEFVERFRREARAAGRLRHPNVVDVTDFGFAKTNQGEDVAYLVMEYLDGCTLAEILEDEKSLSLSWTLDIIEQICSAVHQAHQQGIIHRDLKPENIWLEPNQRGGYTVKVLDFGIAKLEVLAEDEDFSNESSSKGSEDAIKATLSEQETLLISSTENPTARLFARETQQRGLETERLSGNLTKVGTILGTPLYMSPEQCRGEKLDSRSDIYSIGVITYRMLSGKVPFEGDNTTVMQAHIKEEPPPLIADGVPKKVKQIVHQALSKNPDDRPQTAQAFAAKLRAHSEGIGQLLQKSMIIYSEYLPKFLLIGFLVVLPGALVGLSKAIFNALDVFYVIGGPFELFALTTFSVLSFLVQSVSAAFLVGYSTWLVGQRLALPLRPIELTKIFKLIRPKLKKLVVTVVIFSIISFLGVLCCIIPGIWIAVRYLLISPVVVIENLRIKQAFKRSAELVKRSYRTAFALVILSYFAPFVLAILLNVLANAVTKAYFPYIEQIFQSSESAMFLQVRPTVRLPEGPQKVEEMEFRRTIVETTFEMLWMPVSIFLLPFFSITTALFYFKTRLAGGESLQDLLSQFEDNELPKTKWQQKMKEKLISSGK